MSDVLFQWRGGQPVNLVSSPLRQLRSLLASITGASAGRYAGWSRKRLGLAVRAEFAKMGVIYAGKPR